MLSAEKNERLTRVGPGTPMGELLRRFSKKHVKVAFEVFEHGILKRRVLEGHTEEDEDWRVGHPLVFPHMLRVGAATVRRSTSGVPTSG